MRCWTCQKASGRRRWWAKAACRNPTKWLLEHALKGELTEHLSYEKHARQGRNGDNQRNGRSWYG